MKNILLALVMFISLMAFGCGPAIIAGAAGTAGYYAKTKKKNNRYYPVTEVKEVPGETEVVLLPLPPVDSKVVLELQDMSSVQGTVKEYTDDFLTIKVDKMLEQVFYSEILSIEILSVPKKPKDHRCLQYNFHSRRIVFRVCNHK